jgi:hypothetical protein
VLLVNGTTYYVNLAVLVFVLNGDSLSYFVFRLSNLAQSVGSQMIIVIRVGRVKL